MNKETKRAAAVPAGTLFSNATRNLADNLASASVNTNPLRFTVKHWAATTYQDEPRYDFVTRNINRTWWNALYKDVLADYNDATKIVTADMLLASPIKKNQLAILDIMQVYTWYVLVNTFGDVPYSEALDLEKHLVPSYDDATTIYTDLLKRLVADIGNLDPSAAAFSQTEDVVYGSKDPVEMKKAVGKWVKFANTLQFKMGMLLADVNAAVAKTNVEAADAKAFTSSVDNGLFVYLSASPNTNPLYADIILGKRGDYVAAKDFMDQLITLNDPRKSLYFKPNNGGQYAGGIVGSQNTLADMSTPSERLSAATAPLVFLDYTELEFLRAEAIERGFNVAGTAATHYENGIRASIAFWGGSDANATAYMLQPQVAYLTASGSWKQKIGFQKWIGLYNRPFDGWVEMRRLDQPVLTPPVSAISGFPNRYLYPSSEQLVNKENYTKAAAKIGGDKVETKLFWDKF
ncbi:SusD/RagB family nutrient-binding outer membrane lipoprotein [Niabella soli]|uniref:SusD/RagB family nutrient-binding outer membrane lipoprotein n=1 Tax=Niabella soli TaxID=446683 RepID=UPI001FE1AA65|nr:SusD/RagB family nutrient-binding outer membrane lipoprotein [Niabella soli]